MLRKGVKLSAVPRTEQPGETESKKKSMDSNWLPINRAKEDFDTVNLLLLETAQRLSYSMKQEVFIWTSWPCSR